MQTWEATGKIALRNEGYLVGGFFVFLGENRCEIDLCSKQMGGEKTLNNGLKKRHDALRFEILTKR